MSKKALILSAIATGLLLFGFYTYNIAEEQSVNMTTYYPSPTGAFMQMDVHSGLTFKPHNSTENYISDLNCSTAKEGMLAYGLYNATYSANRYYQCSGGSWKEQNLPESWNNTRMNATGSCNSAVLGKIIFNNEANRPYVCTNSTGYNWTSM